MATDVPDSRSLDSWEEAFQYPIPTVRRVEQELRRDIASNKDKLRSLVGVKYRELLGTAQTIVDMNREIQHVESNISSIGRRCNPRVMAKKSNNLHDLKSQSSEKASDDRTFAAQFTLLRNCNSTILKILRKRKSTVLAAKLLVISRLLHNSLSQDKDEPPYIKKMRKLRLSLQKTLRKRIDLRLADTHATTNDMIEAMSAFCLATSSSSADAIRHFHSVRREAVRHQVEKDHPNHDNVLIGLNLYIQTLQKTSELLGGQLSAALEKLTTQPLLDDPVILNLGELNIDVLRPWISTDIQNFTPWIKYNEVSRSESNKQVKKWSKDTFEEYTIQVKNQLQHSQDFHHVLELRKRILETWLPVRNLAPADSSLDILEGLRGMVNHQLVSILRAQREGLSHLGRKVLSVVTGFPENEPESVRSLWDPELAFLDFSDGATTFKEEIINRTLGRGANVLSILELYQVWLESIRTRGDLINGLRSETWDDVLEDEIDEDIIDHVNAVLKEDDPDLLWEQHQSSLMKGFSSLQESLHGSLDHLTEQYRAPQAAFLLRIIREVQTSIPSSVLGDNRPFAEEIIPKLHHAISVEVLSQTPTSILNSNIRADVTRCPGRTLWEGDPSLPVQPSPMAFRLLRELVLAMESLGPDLWNSTAVDQLKNEVGKSIASKVHIDVEPNSNEMERFPPKDLPQSDTEDGEESESDEGDEGEEGKESPTATTTSPAATSGSLRDCKLQLFFDILYLENALALRKPSENPKLDGLHSAINSLEDHLKPGNEAVGNIKERSQTYWERTQLLFNLLG